MSPSKAPAKPVTPDSVKGLMIIETLVLGFLSFWMFNEYMNNTQLQANVNSAVGTNLTAYSIIIGLGIGLGGTVVAFTLWRNLRLAESRLERASAPRLKGGVRHALSTLPTMDEETPIGQSQTTSAPETTRRKSTDQKPLPEVAEKEAPPSQATDSVEPEPKEKPS